MKSQINVTNNNATKQQKTRNAIGISFLVIFASLIFVVAFGFMPVLNSIFIGTFGYFFYVICLAFIAWGILLLKDVDLFLEKQDIIFIAIDVAVFVCILQLATSVSFINDTFGNYLGQTYASQATAGWVLVGVLVYPVQALTHVVATFVLLGVLFVALLTVIIDKLHANKQFKKLNFNQKAESKKETVLKQQNQTTTKQDTTSKTNLHLVDEDVIIADEDFEQEEKQEQTQEELSQAKIILGLSEKDKEKSKNILQASNSAENKKSLTRDAMFANLSSKDAESKTEVVKEVSNQEGRPRKIVHSEFGVKQKANETTEKVQKLSDKDRKNLEFLRSSLGGDLKKRQETKEQPNEQTQNLNKQEQSFEPDTDELLRQVQDDWKPNHNHAQPVNRNRPNLVVEEDEIKDESIFNVKQEKLQDVAKEANTYQKQDFVKVKPKQENQTKIVKHYEPYVAPSVDLLETYLPNQSQTEEDYTQKAEMLEQTLGSFKIPATVVNVTKGPSFTRFKLQMPTGIPVKRVMAYTDDIAMILESQGAVRVEIPIPGENAFGVEVPNEVIDTVGLKDILQAYSFTGSKSLLTFALGKDITGEGKVARLDKMPHLLVAGATGSGKSVCLNALIISLIYKASPQDLRMLLIDPKRVEFTLYNGLPHLLIPDVITDPEKAIQSLAWTIDEMERRFDKFAKYRVRNVDEFNNLSEVKTGMEEKIPYLVIIVDELNDLMVMNKKDMEEKIIRIAQKSRAAGIHLVLATQRPSVNVVTGTIKANLPSRIAFAVTSFTDSKTILDQAGAEKLLGKGDMLYSPNDMPDSIRLQGAFISNEEVARVVNFIKDNNPGDFDVEIEDAMFNNKQISMDIGSGNVNEFDPFLKDAVRNFIKTGSASISRLQRMFGIGFPRAAKIVDQIENLGFISAKDNKNNRTIFITQQEFEEKFGEDL